MKRITLLAPHTHARQPHEAGASLTVSNHAADWLLDRRLATLSRTPKPAPPEPPQPQSADSETTGDRP